MPKAELNAGPLIFRDAPIYVWYEWRTLHNQFTGARRVYIADAVAWWSHESYGDMKGFATKAAEIRIEVYVALGDNTAVWKTKGASTANETLDNLVVLFCMQNNLSFETEHRLHGFANF